MNNPIVDNKRLQIQDPRTREYFDEVLSCYYSGNYRSAIVMLYATVICDFIYKLGDLSNTYGDAFAQQILDDIKALQASNPTSAEWERLLPEKCKNANRIIEIADYSNFESLQRLRHLCAHPVISGSQELYRPNSDIVLGHIINMLDGVLTKPAFHTKDLFNFFVNDIAHVKSLLVTQQDMEHYITSKYLDKVNSFDVEFYFFKSLWKFLFELDNQPCKDNREVNEIGLWLLVKRHKDLSLERFEKEKDYFGRHIYVGKGDRFRLLVKFFNTFPEFQGKLPDDVKLTINNLIDTSEDLKALAVFRSSNPVSHIFNSRPERESTAVYLSEYLRQNVNQVQALDYNIKVFGGAYSYDLGDSRFDTFIEPFINEFSVSQLEQIVKSIAVNSQLYDRRRAMRDNGTIYRKMMELNTTFDFTPYANFHHY